LMASHCSEEPSHLPMLEHLGLKPYLDWSMRLGEGTGALALYPLLRGAAAWCSNTVRLGDLKWDPVS
jgi:nicotinate-nucleotide--dimethylbenzimidazole phosphoribosyltransferase